MSSTGLNEQDINTIIKSTKKMNKTVYITGGSKGIGLGIAEACLREGYKVAKEIRHFVLSFLF